MKTSLQLSDLGISVNFEEVPPFSLQISLAFKKQGHQRNQSRFLYCCYVIEYKIQYSEMRWIQGPRVGDGFSSFLNIPF